MRAVIKTPVRAISWGFSFDELLECKIIGEFSNMGDNVLILLRWQAFSNKRGAG